MITFICPPCAEGADYLRKTEGANPLIDDIVMVNKLMHTRCLAIARDASWCDCQHVRITR